MITEDVLAQACRMYHRTQGVPPRYVNIHERDFAVVAWALRNTADEHGHFHIGRYTLMPRLDAFAIPGQVLVASKVIRPGSPIKKVGPAVRLRRQGVKVTYEE